MNYERPNYERFFAASLTLFGWTLYGFFFASQSYVQQAYMGGTVDWMGHLIPWLTCAYSWALVTPPILYLARRFPIGRENWLGSLAVHIPAAAVFSVIALMVYVGFRVLAGEGFTAAKIENLVATDIHSCILVYFGILAIHFAVNYRFGPAIGKPGTLENTTGLMRPFPAEIIKDGRAPSAFATRFAVKENGRIVLVNVGEIDLVTSEGNYVKLTTSNRSYLVRDTMKAIEQKLDPDLFVRVRRSTIIRVERIQELHPLFNGEFEIVLKNGTKLTSSRRYRRNLGALLKT